MHLENSAPVPDRLLHKRVPAHNRLVMKPIVNQDPAALGGRLTAGGRPPIGGHGPYALDAGSTAAGLHAQISHRISNCSIGRTDKPGSGWSVMLHIAHECTRKHDSSMTGGLRQAAALGHQLLQVGLLLTDMKGELTATHWRQPPNARY